MPGAPKFLGELPARGVVDIHDCGGVWREEFREELLLGIEVRLHRTVVVQMVAGEIRERGGGEERASRTLLVKCRAGTLHHDIFDAVGGEPGEELLQFEGGRRRAVGVEFLTISEVVHDRADHPRPEASSTQQIPCQKRCGRLSAGARDSDKLQSPGGIPGHRLGDARNGMITSA